MSDKKSQDGLSVVEIAIVMVIIGVIMGAIAIGKDTKLMADATKLFKKRVESCLAVAYGASAITYKKYNGTEIDDNGNRLKHFCMITEEENGSTQARIYAPSRHMTILMYEKAKEMLSPDDFTVQSDIPAKKHFDVIINDGYENAAEIPDENAEIPDENAAGPTFNPNTRF